MPETDEDDFADYAREAWGPMVRSGVFLGCSLHEAEDLAQTTLVRCYTAWPSVVAADNRGGLRLPDAAQLPARLQAASLVG